MAFMLLALLSTVVMSVHAALAVEPGFMVPTDPDLTKKFIASSLKLSNRNPVADKIKKLLERRKHKLAVVVIGDVGPVHLQNEALFGADIAAQDAVLYGLGDFEILDLDFIFIGMRLPFHFRIPSAQFTSRYHLKAFMGVPFAYLINRTGLANFTAEGAEVQGDLHLGAAHGHLTLRALEISLSLGTTNVFIEGLVENGEMNTVLNRMISQLTNNFIQEQKERFSKAVTDALFKAINNALKTLPLNDFDKLMFL